MIFLIRAKTKPAYYTMRTGSFPEVKTPGRGANHSPSSSSEVKEKVKLYPPLCLHGRLWGEENDKESVKLAELF
jgi:hypothetical protein